MGRHKISHILISNIYFFFILYRELRTLRQCRGARQMIGECQEAFAECYAKELMGEVRYTRDKIKIEKKHYIFLW